MTQVKKLSAYVHIPFCQRKCDYCDFVSYAGVDDRMDVYFNALFREINLRSHHDSTTQTDTIRNRTLSSIFFGGGTPTYVPSSYIVRTLELLKREIGWDSTCEITLECNPGTLTVQKAKEYYQAGVNRISVGLQCFSDNVLSGIGRIHTSTDFNETLAILAQEGFRQINVDLMIGLPQQTIEDVVTTVLHIISMNVSHVSVYSLSIESNTPMQIQYEKSPELFPSETTERDMYANARSILRKNGFIHYEISNFAQPDRACVHNMLCWRQHEYLGFGAGAHSYLGDTRFANTADLRQYLLLMRDTDFSRYEALRKDVSRIGQPEAEKEFFLLGFRLLEGVSEHDFTQRFQKSMGSYYPVLNRLVHNRLLIKTKSGYRLSEKGIHHANQVFMEFV